MVHESYFNKAVLRKMEREPSQLPSERSAERQMKNAKEQTNVRNLASLIMLHN